MCCSHLTRSITHISSARSISSRPKVIWPSRFRRRIWHEMWSATSWHSTNTTRNWTSRGHLTTQINQKGINSSRLTKMIVTSRSSTIWVHVTLMKQSENSRSLRSSRTSATIRATILQMSKLVRVERCRKPLKLMEKDYSMSFAIQWSSTHLTIRCQWLTTIKSATFSNSYPRKQVGIS